MEATIELSAGRAAISTGIGPNHLRSYLGALTIRVLYKVGSKDNRLNMSHVLSVRIRSLEASKCFTTDLAEGVYDIFVQSFCHAPQSQHRSITPLTRISP